MDKGRARTEVEAEAEGDVVEVVHAEGAGQGARGQLEGEGPLVGMSGLEGEIGLGDGRALGGAWLVGWWGGVFERCTYGPDRCGIDAHVYAPCSVRLSGAQSCTVWRYVCLFFPLPRVQCTCARASNCCRRLSVGCVHVCMHAGWFIRPWAVDVWLGL